MRVLNSGFLGFIWRSFGTPFEVLYGHSPRALGINAADACPVQELQSWLVERAVMQNLVKQHLARAQERIKRQADKRCSERQFSVGDKVFLKLQPYVQCSLAPRANQKLAFKFFGPFEIIEKIGAVAYKLLPTSSAIHPVFHVSQLKTAVPGDLQVTAELPDLTDTILKCLFVCFSGEWRLMAKGLKCLFSGRTCLFQWRPGKTWRT